MFFLSHYRVRIEKANIIITPIFPKHKRSKTLNGLTSNISVLQFVIKFTLLFTTHNARLKKRKNISCNKFYTIKTILK